MTGRKPYQNILNTLRFIVSVTSAGSKTFHFMRTTLGLSGTEVPRTLRDLVIVIQGPRVALIPLAVLLFL